MATPDEAGAALREAIITCTDALQAKSKDLNSTTAERFSLAVLHLAEAHAWLQSPEQSHGGGASPQP